MPRQHGGYPLLPTCTFILSINLWRILTLVLPSNVCSHEITETWLWLRSLMSSLSFLSLSLSKETREWQLQVRQEQMWARCPSSCLDVFASVV
jgi:hypothetical protein